MRIIHVSRDYIYPLGGMEEFIYQITARLGAKEVNTEIVTTTFRSSQNRYSEDLVGNLPVKRFPVSLHLLGYCYSKNLNEYLSKTDFDVIHAHGWGNNAIDASVKWGGNGYRTIFVTPYELFHTERFKPLKFFYNRIYGAKVLKKAIIIALTSTQAKQFKSIGAKNVVVVPGGVNPNCFEQPRFSYKEKFGIDGKVILGVGRLTRYKGFHSVLIALKKVLESYPETYLFIAGQDWGAKKDLESLASRLNITNHVIFLGSLNNSNELCAAYYDADLYVCSSKVEGFGLTIIEAMACGKPVISTRTGVALDLEIEGALLTYDYDNHNQLAHLICEILKDNGLAKNLRDNGKKLIRKNYTWDAVTDRLLKLYHYYSNVEKKAH